MVQPFDAPEAPTFRCPSCGGPAAENARACVHCGSLLATRRCLRCFALSPREAERCLRCGALLPRDALRSGPPGKCPDCAVDMAVAAFGAVGYTECPRCGGLFLQKEAFEVVTADADSRAQVRLGAPPVIRQPGEPVPPVRYRKCPVCHKLMNRQNYAGGSGVVIDVCGPHGFWFDRGELTAIVDFLEKGGWERVKKRERERLAEEVRNLESRKEFHRATSLPASLAERDARGLETLGELASFLGSLFLGKQ